MVAPLAVGAAVPAVSRWARMKTLATSSVSASSRSWAVSVPRSGRTDRPFRAPGSLRDANHGATLDSTFAIGLPYLFSDTHGLFDQCLNNFAFGHGLDDFALHENLALAVSGRHAQVCFACLTWAIDDAAHDGHPE